MNTDLLRTFNIVVVCLLFSYYLFVPGYSYDVSGEAWKAYKSKFKKQYKDYAEDSFR